jgi:AraC-like DNA-binding protein
MTRRNPDGDGRSDPKRADISAARCKRMYEGGLSTKEIAADLKCSQSTVCRRLQEAGVQIRASAARLQMMRAAARRLAERSGAASSSVARDVPESEFSDTSSVPTHAVNNSQGGISQ